MTTQDEIDEGLLRSAMARKEENPIYFPTPEELAAIDRAVIKQLIKPEPDSPPHRRGGRATVSVAFSCFANLFMFCSCSLKATTKIYCVHMLIWP